MIDPPGATGGRPSVAATDGVDVPTGGEQGGTPKDTVFCDHKDICIPSITVNVDDDLKTRMEDHPEINWSEVTRQAIREKVEVLELLDELTAESGLTEADVEEIAAAVDERTRERLEEG